jgi:hypothetical protein
VKAAKDTLWKTRTWKMLHQGAYSPIARAVARVLVKAGCSHEHIGLVIRTVCKTAGVEVRGKMSRRTVGRCILEGGIAAKIQLGFEMAKADSRFLLMNCNSFTYVSTGLTASSDGTSHRKMNIESNHFAYKAVDYHSNGSPASIKHVNQLAGIVLSVDHTAETQWDFALQIVADTSDTLNRSPLSERTSTTFSLIQWAYELCGMNNDHAADQKKKA